MTKALYLQPVFFLPVANEPEVLQLQHILARLVDMKLAEKIIVSEELTIESFSAAVDVFES